MTPKQADFVRLYFELGIEAKPIKPITALAKPNTLHRKSQRATKNTLLLKVR